jgi:hypothetical protein
LGYWKSITESFDVRVAQTVSQEARFYTNPSDTFGRQIPTSIESDLADQKIEMFSLNAVDLVPLERERVKFKSVEIDEGEQESIAAVFNDLFPDCLICLIDAAAIRCTVMVGKGKQ